MSPDSKLVAVGSVDGTVRLLDATTWKETGQLTGHRLQVRAVAFSPGGKMLATGGDDQVIQLWDVATRKEQASLQGATHSITSLASAPTTRRWRRAAPTGR
jgi:WD40 repeat protein